jgi:hypothetical protein
MFHIFHLQPSFKITAASSNFHLQPPFQITCTAASSQNKRSYLPVLYTYIFANTDSAPDYLHCNLIKKPVSLPVELHSDIFNLLRSQLQIK